MTQAGVGGEVVHVGVASSFSASPSLFHVPFVWMEEDRAAVSPTW